MYEVWFMDCCGEHSFQERFDSLEEAWAYIDDWDAYLSCEEWMYIKE
jgi:hypothetical protein